MKTAEFLGRHFPEFVRLQRKRFEAGALEYGDSGFNKGLIDILKEQQEELLDHANYAAMAWTKIEEMKVALLGGRSEDTVLRLKSGESLFSDGTIVKR